MAITKYGVNDSLAVKIWARGLQHEVLKHTPIAPLIGDDADSIIHRKDELKKGGDKITFALRTQLTGTGVTENQALEGNEEALSTYADSLYVNELAHAVRVKGENTIDEQRILFDTRTEAKSGLRDWYAKRMSIGMMLHWAGYVGLPYSHANMTIDRTLPQFNMNNTITAASSNRILRAAAGSGETNTTDEALESDDVFNLNLLDFALEKANTSGFPIRPAIIDGEEKYVCFLHPYQVTDMRTNTDTGQWQDIVKAVYSGSKNKNPFYNGSLGEYNNCVLRSSNDIPYGYHSTTLAAETDVRRAVLLGAQAGAIAFGKNFGSGGTSSFKWVEETFDYERELGVAVQTLFGAKKTVFNSEDFGSIVISTYAAAH